MLKNIKKKLQTKKIAKKVIYFKEIDSTQKEAKRLAEIKEQNGTIILAEYQTDGIGTHDRYWYSKKMENILFSLILYPNCKLEELNSITVDIAKCIVNVIFNLYGYKLNIKKPNDIMYNNKKLGGILTQIVTSRR